MKVVKEKKDYSFRQVMASLVLQVNSACSDLVQIYSFKCIRTGSRPQIEIPVGDDMPSLSKVVEKPSKAEAIAKHQSRFQTT